MATHKFTRSILILAASFVWGCGDSPTGPSPTPSEPPQSTQTQPTPPPAPAPEPDPEPPQPAPQPEPAPAPTPPAPAPEPEPEPKPEPPAPPAPPAPKPPAPQPPAPSPEPPRVVVYVATVTLAHWYGPALLPQRFEVSWDEQTLRFGPLTLPVAIPGDSSVFARTADMSVQIVGASSWTFNGVAGMASGTLERK